MTQEDFDTIATAFGDYLRTLDSAWFEEGAEHVERAAKLVANRLAQNNPYFDSQRFAQKAEIKL